MSFSIVSVVFAMLLFIQFLYRTLGIIFRPRSHLIFLYLHTILFIINLFIFAIFLSTYFDLFIDSIIYSFIYSLICLFTLIDERLIEIILLGIDCTRTGG